MHRGELRDHAYRGLWKVLLVEPTRSDIKQLTIAVLQVARSLDKLTNTVQKLVDKSEESSDQEDGHV